MPSAEDACSRLEVQLARQCHLNYRDGWFFFGRRRICLYTFFDAQGGGVGYEISPVTDFNRDTLLPDSDRVHLNIGASYRSVR